MKTWRSGPVLRRVVCQLALCGFLLSAANLSLHAEVGDPQLRTDHPWYPGELACSTFEALFATQAGQYHRATGQAADTDEQKALASWFWRNTHYYHGEEGAEDLWNTGFGQGGDSRNREYWTGLFAHGFGLCGTTHSQWTAEMEHLLGHTRARGVGVEGHNAFEVWLTGGAYGQGQWALLDHDISTVIFDRTGKRLLSIAEIKTDWRQLTDRQFQPDKQNGWLVCGLAAGDGSGYRQFNVAEYLPGYAAVPPMVHLRRGETLRRYSHPGLDDGKTFVFWGRNYKTGGIAGPERSLTWVNQPEQMFGSRTGTRHQPGQARYGNAVYVYQPDFASGDYREGIVAETATNLTFSFATPYIIAATPPNDKSWGIYDSGGRQGLRLAGRLHGPVEISVDRGRSWQACGSFADGMDLTDKVKGRRQYWLRLPGNAPALAGSGLTITTVCQANPAIFPHLNDGGSQLHFRGSGQAVVSAGPNRNQALTHLVAGAFSSANLTLALGTPHAEPVTAVYAAAHVASGNPPDPKVKFQIEYSTDQGKTWQPVVRDWQIARRGEQPQDFWSQSFCYGSAAVSGAGATNVQVRFHNDGGRKYLRAEMHLIYRTRTQDPTGVTLAWRDDQGQHEARHQFLPGDSGSWTIPTGKGVRMRWVEMSPALPAGRGGEERDPGMPQVQ